MMMDAPTQAAQFGRFQLLERIAIGGMAEIFLAKVQGAMGFEKSMVIKRILPQYADDADFLRMFVTEAKLVCHLEHPNIVQVHELGEIEGQYYIAMETVTGIDGRQLWRTLAKRRQRLPGVLSLYIVSEFLKGLDYAHRAVGPDGRLLGVVHRDISPSNVLISYRGDVKIGDFGIALVEHESRTQAGVLKGKYGYMSPEQVAGVKVDHRSDLFSAGVVLTEFLLGRRLFLGRNDFETLDKVLNVRLDVLEENADALPGAVVGILRQALMREPHERFQSAREFHDAIMELLYSQGKRITNETLAAFMAQHVVPHMVFKREPVSAQASTFPATPSRSPVVPGSVAPEDEMLERLSGKPGEAGTDPEQPPLVEPPPEPPMPGADTLSKEVTGQELVLDPQEIPTEEGEQLEIQETGDINLGSGSESLSGTDIPGRKRPSVLVHQVLADADRPRTDQLPDFRGRLSARSVTKVLFRFFVVSESGLLTMTGPHAHGQQAELISWVQELRKEHGYSGPDPQRAPQRTCELHFNEGKPILASADRTEEEVVAFLLRTGVLEQDQVRETVKRKPKRALMPALIALEHVGPLQVSRHITAFIMDNVLDTFGWREGSFAFFRDRSCSSEAFPIRLEGMELIRKGVGAMHEGPLDAFFQQVKARHAAPNRTPPMWIGAFNPDDAMSAVYRAAAESPTVDELLARCLKEGDPLRIKQALYLLLECDMVLLTN